MRENKFRAWDAYENRMWYSHENNTTFLDKEGEEVTFYFYFSPKTGKMEAVTESFPYLVTDDPFNIYDTEKHYHDVMQYTGLKDKNDIEIYEGDIVLFSNGGIEKVKFDDIRLDHIPTVGYRESHELEVIGNIYENPSCAQALTERDGAII